MEDILSVLGLFAALFILVLTAYAWWAKSGALTIVGMAFLALAGGAVLAGSIWAPVALILIAVGGAFLFVRVGALIDEFAASDVGKLSAELAEQQEAYRLLTEQAQTNHAILQDNLKTANARIAELEDALTKAGANERILLEELLEYAGEIVARGGDKSYQQRADQIKRALASRAAQSTDDSSDAAKKAA